MPRAMRETGGATVRTIGLFGAIGVGVGAIVGGGILVLAGTAFVHTGPAAAVAFGACGFVALITALSYAEISTAFPESGGTYAFAIKFLGVRAAFGIGWILWFAYIVAGVLYALGFASFTALALDGAWRAAGAWPPGWLSGRNFQLLLAIGATAVYMALLLRKSGGGGNGATIGKVVLFVVLVLVGLVAVIRQPIGDTTAALSPFFPGGMTGLLSAMGFCFIALQGFDLIPAIAGEIKNPRKVIPRAMFASLAIALIVYIPLLLIVAAVGSPVGTSIGEVAAAQPDTVMAVAIENYMGRVGYWVVIIAAILSTLSALQANLFAASRVALSMAVDRTLPKVLGRLHSERRTPIMAIYATGLTLVAILFMVPDLASAGAAASLIFLISFTLAHVMTYLARTRGAVTATGFRTPAFPLVPIVGGAACAALALFQATQVPDAGGIVGVWVGLGVLLYVALFKSGAEYADASAEGLDPSLARLRGKSPLVLLPIANPAHARAMVAVANALAPPDVGKVLLLSIVKLDGDAAVPPLERLDDAQAVVRHALSSSYEQNEAPEALITTAAQPWEEIRRIADEHDCESLLLGLGNLSATDALEGELEDLMNDVDCDFAVMRASPNWRLEQVDSVLVPVGGRGDHELRARLLGALSRTGARSVTFLSVVGPETSDAALRGRRNDIEHLADLKIPKRPIVSVVRSADPAQAILDAAAKADLVILGVQQVGWGRKVFGPLALRIAAESPTATILVSHKRSRAYSDIYRPLRDAVNVIPWNLRRPGDQNSDK